MALFRNPVLAGITILRECQTRTNVGDVALRTVAAVIEVLQPCLSDCGTLIVGLRKLAHGQWRWK